MKTIHTSILDFLANHISFDDAAEMTNNVLEFFEGNAAQLYYDLVDHLTDYLPTAQSETIAEACVDAAF